MNIKIFIALILCVSTPAFAATQLVEITKGSSNDVTLSPGIDGYDFAYLSPGNTPAMLKINLTAPKGAELSVRIIGVSKDSTIASAYERIDSGYTGEIATSGGKFKKSLVVGSASSSKVKTDTAKYKCGGRMLAAFFPYFSSLYLQAMGVPAPNEAAVCSFLFSDYVEGSNSTPSTPVSNGTSLSVNGRLLKDLCTDKHTYAVFARVNLKKVSESARTGTLSITISEEIHKGPRDGSIKPESHGKWAPQPLLLVSAITGKSDMALKAQFKSKGPILTLTQPESVLKGVATAFWRSEYLTRFLVGPWLKGGRASIFNSSNYTLAGIACMPMNRRRWSTPGYGN